MSIIAFIDLETFKILVLIYGLSVVAYSVYFCLKYGRPNKILFRFPPPITTIVTFITFIAFTMLMFDSNIITNIFGSDPNDARQGILQIMGGTYTGFILIITIFWGLMTGRVRNISRAIYRTSYILVGLFFYVSLAFYCILANL